MIFLYCSFIFFFSLVSETAYGEGKTYQHDEFTSSLRKLDTTDQIIPLCKEYIEHSSDQLVMHTALSVWIEEDRESANRYFTEFLRNHPESALAAYYLGTVAEQPVEAIELARMAIRLNPDLIEAYRLLLSVYSKNLFRGAVSDSISQRLQKELPHDEPLLTILLQTDATNSDTLRDLLYYHRYKGEYSQALGILDKGSQLRIPWVTPIEYAQIYSLMSEFQKVKQELDAYIGNSVQSGQVAPEERSNATEGLYTQVLSDTGAYDALIDFFQKKPDSKTDKQILYNLAYVNALKGDIEQAFSYLNHAITAGWDQLDLVTQNSAFAKLHPDSRWESIKTRIQMSWEKNIDRRKSELVSRKMNRPSPEWSARDLDGATISRESLKGQIIILDFWASWCRPSITSMPILDTWTRSHNAADIQVFSINIWEQNVEQAINFFNNNHFAMKMLIGTERLAADFKVDGIPYICVIDPDGNICFEEKGFHTLLADNLSIWTDALRKLPDPGIVKP